MNASVMAGGSRVSAGMNGNPEQSGGKLLEQRERDQKETPGFSPGRMSFKQCLKIYYFRKIFSMVFPCASSSINLSR